MKLKPKQTGYDYFEHRVNFENCASMLWYKSIISLPTRALSLIVKVIIFSTDQKVFSKRNKHFRNKNEVHIKVKVNVEKEKT